MNNLVVISDTHINSQVGLCPPEGITLDGGGSYEPSIIQQKMWKWWEEFWYEWIPDVTEGEPYTVVHNGDLVEGLFKKSVDQISHNLADQEKLTLKIMLPIVGLADGRYIQIRGTEAHSGTASVEEERIAQKLGARPNNIGQHSRLDLWYEMHGHLIHFLHHIGTTSSSAYEGTAVAKELVEEYNEAARWCDTAPSIVVRSHRHRNYEIRLPTKQGIGISMVTAAWQLKTPFAFKIPGARIAPAQIGGSLIRFGRHNELYTRHKVWTVGRSETEYN